MPDSHRAPDFGPAVHVQPGSAGAATLVVCEHASHRIPAELRGLGLPAETLQSHIAWDPGALGVAEALARLLGAALVSGGVSRLVYDCNRPPEAPSAIPARSEVFDIPGNANLSALQRQQRVEAVYAPFRAALSDTLRERRATLRLMVTVHSFTPVYNGQRRDSQIGILHGRDAGFATAMLAATPADIGLRVRLNEPYSAADGVAHTLDLHGAANTLPSVMLEIRNDLIRTGAAQATMAHILAPWITTALDRYQRKGAA